MRRRIIQTILPLLLCTVPFLAAAAVAAAIQPDARTFYFSRITWMDVLILGLGGTLFLSQMLMAYFALRWRQTNFDERFDTWLSNLAQGAEWFPLLGLLGTVAAILETFHSFKVADPQSIISSYAPAITATGSGLFMALVNILPTWLVPVGRDLIRTLGGPDPSAASASPGLAKPAPAVARPTPAGTNTGS